MLDATSTQEFVLHSLPALSIPQGVMSMTPAKDSSARDPGASNWPWRALNVRRQRTITAVAAVGALAIAAIWGFSQSGAEPRTAVALPSAAPTHVPAVAAIPAPVPVPEGPQNAQAVADASPMRSPAAPPPRRVPVYASPRPTASSEPPAPPPPPRLPRAGRRLRPTDPSMIATEPRGVRRAARESGALPSSAC